MPKKKPEEEEERPKWVNPNANRAEDEPRQKWVNPNKPSEEAQRPKWVNPNKGQKHEQRQPRSRQWVNPKWQTARQRMDKRLERAGLLNYQTQGLSQAEIAHKYAMAGISISDNSTWFKENYGADAPETITDRAKMFQYRNDVFAGKNPSIMTGGAGQAPTAGPTITAGGQADRPINYVQGQNGMLVKAPSVPAQGLRPVDNYAISGGAAFATNEQALQGQANWTDMTVAERSKILNDPNFYKGEITKYPAWMQQQILADPDFQWDKLPAWQQTYYGLSSSPAGMGAAQGALMGLGGGPVGGGVGAALGGALGWVAAKSGYDPTKEFWEQGGNGRVKDLTAGAFGLMNWLAEQAEKGVGILVQSAGILTGNAEFDPHKRNLNWDAGANTFEILGPALVEGSWKKSFENMKGKIDNGEPMTVRDFTRFFPGVQAIDLLINPDAYKGEEVYLGADLPVELQQNIYERMDEAKKRIEGGEPYREVMMDFQTGVVGQISDMAGQAIADPLNFLPNMTTKAAGAVADATGHTVAAQALKSSEGLREAGSKYKTLVQTGQALTIDPNFKVDQMGRFSRWVAGVNEQGAVKAGSLIGTQKGLLDPITRKQGFVEDMATQTPHSRAQTGAGMFYENVSAMMQMFDDPAQAGKYLKALANNDMQTWSELGSRFAESPEFYTILPALKDFNTTQLDGIMQTWEMTAGNRDYLARVADVMGENKGTLLEDLAKHGTAEQDFARVVKKLNESTSPAAKALLAEVKAGTFTAESLKQMVDVFTGEGALPWHEGQWKAMMLDTMGEHFDKWVTQRLMLDKSPEAVSAFYRTSALMKQAQSILLLGGSPGYALTNGMSNMVHRAVSGLGGFMTPGQIDKFMDRFGVTPARLEEGVGIGGMVEQAAGKTNVKTSAMEKAVKGKGRLAAAKDALGKVSKGMPFSKLSSWFEKMEGRQAFTIGMKDMWSQSWRRGVGFRKMTGQMENAIRAMGQDPNRIYAAIEAGMNIDEIEKAVLGREQEVQARSLIHDAAQRTGMSAGDAAQMLEKMGVLDVLDSYLKGQTTKDGISQAFRKAEREAQDWIDMRTGEDLKATAESVKQRVGLEGAAAALDVSMKAHAEYTDVWMDHYYRFGEVMNDLYTMPDRAQMDKAIDHAYDLSGQEFRRVNARNAANYKGIFDAWGMSGEPKALRALDAMGAADKAMGDAYVQMRANWKEWRQKWGNDPKNPARWDELESLRAKNDRLFKQAFKAKHEAEVKQGGALGEIYESLYGPAAGEAARLWWEDVVKFNDEMVVKEREFRESINEARKTGAGAEDIAAEKQKYYAETKIMQIAELEKINGEGIARLERVIRGGAVGGGGLTVGGGPKGPVDGGVVDGGRLAVDGETPAGFDTPAENTQATQPASNVDEVNALMAAAEQRKAVEIGEKAARVESVWDVAEEYWGKGGNYSREILQDRFALLNALRKPEYGGIPDLFDLSDGRLTPELVRQVMENRKVAKETNAAARADEAFKVTQGKRGRKFDTSQITEDTSILRAIALHGGIDLNLAKDLTGEVKPKSAPGVFTRRGSMKGYGIDEMARLLADDGYPIRLDDVNDPGGIQQVTDLINKARAGDKVYPMGHDYSAELNAAEAAWAEGFNFDEVQEIPFDSALWQTEFDTAVRGADLGKVYEMIGNFPEEQLGTWKVESGRWTADIQASIEEVARLNAERARLGEIEIVPTEDGGAVITFLDRSKNKLTPDDVARYGGMNGVRDEVLRTQNNIIDSKIGIEERRIQERGGETWRGFLSRVADDVAVRATEDVTAESVAGHAARAEESIRVAEDHAEAVTRRTMLLESLAEAFPAEADKVGAWGEVLDATAGWYARMTGADADDFFHRYFGDARRGEVGGGRLGVDGEGLMQEAFHGSPYKFDKFTLDHIGEGEGAQAYGWGLYFAGDQAVAEFYRQKLTPPAEIKNWSVAGIELIRRGEYVDYSPRTRSLSEEVRSSIAESLLIDEQKIRQSFEEGGLREARKLMKEIVQEEVNRYKEEYPEAVPYAERILAEVDKARFNAKKETGQTYRVELPDENYLLWDKPLSEQPEAVRKLFIDEAKVERMKSEYFDSLPDEAVAIAKRMLEDDPSNLINGTHDADWQRLQQLAPDINHNAIHDISDDLYSRNKGNGSDLYGDLADRLGSDKAASLALKEAGINGIQYLDGSSRGKGEGNYNYVIFDDAAVQIKETFYQKANPTPKEEVGGGRLGVDGEGSGKPQPIKNEGGVNIYAEKILTSNARANLDIGTETTRLAPVSNMKKNYKVEVVDYWVIPDKPFEPVFKVYEEVLHKGNVGNTWREVKKFPNWVGKEGDALVKSLSSETKQPDMFGAGTTKAAEGIPGEYNKGMVTFEEGVKGTITAFERGDFSTVVHETGHIYRRMLADVAERTDNPYILRDLKTVEEWAGVKDGAWDRTAEEKFARGFEEYIAEGRAPTPALARAFEQFKSWMLDVYRAITGSQIDVKLSDDVRRVFDRMLGADGRGVIGADGKAFIIGDSVTFSSSRWKIADILDNGNARLVNESGDVVETTPNRMQALEKVDLKINEEARARDAAAIRESDMFQQLKEQARKARERRGAVDGGRLAVDGDQLFQSEQPFGRYDEASGWRAESEGLDDGWREKVRPLLREMEQLAVDGGRSFDYGGDRASAQDGGRDMSPEGQAMLRKYMRQVQNEMATTKLATVRHAERQRDFALLNYSRRYGVDRMADFAMPYQFYPTRSVFTWAGRALDKPALYSNYARLKMQSERYENDLPERMRGKIKIAAPWLPEWAGGSLYIDPFKNLFFPETMVRYLQRAQQDKTYQQIETERVMQEWLTDGTYTEADIKAAVESQQGKIWERAVEEAAMRREGESANPMDFFTGFFGPAWYLSTPLNLAGIEVPGISKGDPNKVSTLPIGNTARALETVTKGTWAEPAGQLFGLIGKAEDWGREKFNLPTHGEYAEYYTKRQIANMVAEGKISSEQAQMAMLEKTGTVWDEAVGRVDMELAMRVPLAGVTYAALHDGLGGAAKAALPSMFGASLLPAGELEYRGLKDEWDEAWKKADAGDTTAISTFYDEHPEYEAWLAKNKDDGELLQSFLVGQIWDAYMEMGKTNQKQARAELGELFQQAFLDKETRSYESIPVDQLAAWAKMMGGLVPKVGGGQLTVDGKPVGSGQLAVDGKQKLNLYPEAVTGITDQFFSQRTEKFPTYYEDQAGYYALATKAEKRKYLQEHPNLKAYWNWKDGWYDAYPQYVPIFNGNAFDRVDTSGWMPGLEDIVRETAYTGGSLPSGAQAALMNVWMLEGMPMDNFDTWVKSQVMPGMMYGSE